MRPIDADVLLNELNMSSKCDVNCQSHCGAFCKNNEVIDDPVDLCELINGIPELDPFENGEFMEWLEENVLSKCDMILGRNGVKIEKNPCDDCMEWDCDGCKYFKKN